MVMRYDYDYFRHADGSVKFWDASAGTLQILYKLKCSKGKYILYIFLLIIFYLIIKSGFIYIAVIK